MKPRIILSLALLAALPLSPAHAGTGTAITGDVTVDTRSSDPVTIPDAALLDALRDTLGKPTGDITEADLLTLTNLRLDANAGDIDGSVASYAWTWAGGSSSSAATTVILPYGTTEFSLTVTDDAGATATAATSVEVVPLATVDSDGDGLSDLVEYTLRDQGFDWDSAQPDLAAAVEAAGLLSRSDLPAEGYYDIEGMRALQAPAPVIARDAATGKARLTLGIQKSSDLESFTPLPATAPEVSITPEGEIQFEFDTPEGSGFYRIEVK